MNSALLRQEEIEFYSPVYDEDGLGEYPKDWKFEHTARAGLINQSMNRTFDAERVGYDLSKTFVVRRYVKVEEDWRIKWNGKFYYIISIDINKYYNDKTILVDIVET